MNLYWKTRLSVAWSRTWRYLLGLGIMTGIILFFFDMILVIGIGTYHVGLDAGGWIWFLGVFMMLFCIVACIITFNSVRDAITPYVFEEIRSATDRGTTED